MSKLKFIVLAFTAFLFSGCADFIFWDSPVRKTVVKKPKPAPVQLPSGSIRGVIKNVSYQDSGYCYEISALDAANGKLPSGIYCADKFYHNVGDTVYAGVKNGKIASMLLIDSRNLKSSQSSKSNKTNIVKTDKKRDLGKKSSIDIPKSQNISFD